METYRPRGQSLSMKRQNSSRTSICCPNWTRRRTNCKVSGGREGSGAKKTQSSKVRGSTIEFDHQMKWRSNTIVSTVLQRTSKNELIYIISSSIYIVFIYVFVYERSLEMNHPFLLLNLQALASPYLWSRGSNF